MTVCWLIADENLWIYMKLQGKMRKRKNIEKHQGMHNQMMPFTLADEACAMRKFTVYIHIYICIYTSRYV